MLFRSAIAAVLRLVGSAIRFGPFSVSLVLIPIVLGAPGVVTMLLLRVLLLF